MKARLVADIAPIYPASAMRVAWIPDVWGVCAVLNVRPIKPRKCKIKDAKGGAEKMKTCKSGLHKFVGERCKLCQRISDKNCKLKNKEKIKEYKETYRIENAEKIKKYNLEWAEKNREKLREKKRIQRNKNPTASALYSKKWREKNPGKNPELTKQWRKNNPDKCMAHSHKRRARKRSATGSLSADVFEKLFKMQKGKCVVCHRELSSKSPRSPLDHITSLAKGGSNTDDNIQLLCKLCNSEKFTKDPITFMQSKGYLL